jgi:hypothetical protein
MDRCHSGYGPVTAPALYGIRVISRLAERRLGSKERRI